MKHLFFSLLLLLINLKTGTAQSALRSLHPYVTVDTYATLSRPGVRLVRDPISGHLVYGHTEGDVFQLRPDTTGQLTEVLIADQAQHGIDFLQGMAFADSILILVGIRRLPYEGVGRVMKGELQPDGSRRWRVLLETAPYPYSGTSFDHAFNGVCITRGRDSIYVNSGSRTDHGEVQDNGGRFPNLRETALTARIFKLPLAAENLTLPNDLEGVRQSGWLYCEGVRNTFDLALNSEGQLFGAENAGNRSDPEELNWLRPGRHYGFPWIVGGNETPQQFPDYDPLSDPLLSPSYRSPDFRNDPTYPPRPNVVFTPAVVNTGPEANSVVDPNTRNLVPSSQSTTFTSHASPLGLVFDTDSVLADFTGLGFVLGYTPGRGLDLSSLRLTYDSTLNNYRVQVTRVAEGFDLPVDAELVGTTLYVLERDRNAISRVQFRPRSYPEADLSLSMQSSVRTAAVGSSITFYITVRNDGPHAARSVRVQNRLPIGLTFIASADFQAAPDGLLASLDELQSGQARRLTYEARLTLPGVYRNSAQIVSASVNDPDSRPGTGTADGEDDAATVNCRSLSVDGPLRESPNPAGVLLPSVQSSQPAPNPNQPDLSVSLRLSNPTPRPNDVVTLTLQVRNEGGQPANPVQLRCLLSNNLTFASGHEGLVNENTLLSGEFSIASGSVHTRTIQLRAAAVGPYLIKTTLISPPDADSTPDNGYSNGEDDEAQLMGRVVSAY